MTRKQQNKRPGRYVKAVHGDARFEAFVPPPLPPDPPLDYTHFQHMLDKANQALGRLDEATRHVPDMNLLLYFFVRKEALLSSQIEGTQSSFADLLLFEIDETPSVPVDDVEEVTNYIAAMNHGLLRMKEGFPLSLRLIREMHQKLLQGGRGNTKAPGEFRRSQNWIGGARPDLARFVPPPPDQIMRCLDDMEKFIHDEDKPVPVLVKAALLHVQFETIHPFLDGNGRIGRLLITLVLCAENVLSAPSLYLSLYLKTYCDDYYDHLSQVRLKGAWEEWILFFLHGVVDTSEQTTNTIKRITILFEEDAGKIGSLGRARQTAFALYERLQHHPIMSIQKAAKEMNVSFPTATKAFGRLTDLGIAKEITGKKRHRLFAYPDYLNILNQGTEPI